MVTLKIDVFAACKRCSRFRTTTGRWFYNYGCVCVCFFRWHADDKRQYVLAVGLAVFLLSLPLLFRFYFFFRKRQIVFGENKIIFCYFHIMKKDPKDTPPFSRNIYIQFSQAQGCFSYRKFVCLILQFIAEINLFYFAIKHNDSVITNSGVFDTNFYFVHTNFGKTVKLQYFRTY